MVRRIWEKGGSTKEKLTKRSGVWKRAWWQAGGYQLNPMFAFLSSDMRSIFAFNYHTYALPLSQHYIVENNFAFEPTLYSGKQLF